jgi:hypothetical protein
MFFDRKVWILVAICIVIFIIVIVFFVPIINELNSKP